MQYTAILDFGSLKLKLSIFNKKNLVLQESFLTLMGKELDVNDNISSHSLGLLKDSIFKAKQIIDSQHVSRVVAYGTEAYRKIKNKEEIAGLFNYYFPNVNLNIISQEDEADLFFKSVESCFNEYIYLCDIGGGSVQLLYGKNNVENKHLYKTGTYYLQQKYSPNNAELPMLIDEAVKEVKGEIVPLSKKCDYLIFGSTCMQDFILACNNIVNLDLKTDLPFPLHNFYLSLDTLKLLLSEIIKLQPEDRAKFYPNSGYFIYGADYLLINLIAISESVGAKYIYPSNFNTSYAFAE
jgi:exopolyphosphatase/pppGpp-phosphohydrolase